MATSLIDQATELTAQNKIEPVTQDFDESKGVEGRTASIIAKESPLQQSAANSASNAMAARGLTNSSLAVGAGQKAVIDSAVPIANADANLYQQQALTNQSAKNSAATNNAQIGSSLGGQAMGLENSNTQQTKSLAEQARQFNESQTSNVGMFDRELAQKAQQFNLTQQQTTALANLDSQTKLALAQTESGWRTQTGNNANVANAWGSMMQQIGNIQNNASIEAGAKATMIQGALDSFRAFANASAAISTIDVSQLLNFGISTPPPPPAPAPAPDPYSNNSGGEGGGD